MIICIGRDDLIAYLLKPQDALCNHESACICAAFSKFEKILKLDLNDKFLSSNLKYTQACTQRGGGSS